MTASMRDDPPPGYGVFEHDFDGETLWVFQTATEAPPDGYRGRRSVDRGKVIAWAWEHHDARMAESRCGPADVNDLVFWIAKGADGIVRGGVIDEADQFAWTMLLADTGWERVPGCHDPPMPLMDAGETLGELSWRAANAGLHGDGIVTPGPWRIEMTLRALMPAED